MEEQPRGLIHRLPHAQDLPLPRYRTSGSVGMDLAAAIDETIEIACGTRQMIPTGCQISMPDGHEAQIRSRSGLALKHGVTVLNSPGTIDSDYRGEIFVLLINHGDQTFRIRRGDRVAQLVFAPVVHLHLEECESLSTTERGAGGFGSTGISDGEV